MRMAAGAIVAMWRLSLLVRSPHNKTSDNAQDHERKHGQFDFAMARHRVDVAALK
jgi:hypothetical protein